MTFSEKLVELRRKAGLSQEELASRLEVSRQAVSKWESGQTLPDLERAVALSRLFGVSLDYLMKEEQAEPEPCTPEPAAPAEPEPPLHRVSLEEARQVLALSDAAAPKMALATGLCVVSPTALILLAALSENHWFPLSEAQAAGVGLCVLFVQVAVAVGLFLNCGALTGAYAYLEKEPIEQEPGVEELVHRRREEFRVEYHNGNIWGTVLCILSMLPIFAAMVFAGSDWSYALAVDLLLVLVAIGCVSFVRVGTPWAAMNKLLEEGDYTRERKALSGCLARLSGGYWLVITAVFLYCTFGPNGNWNPRDYWLVWAIGGVLYGALAGLLRLLPQKQRRKN